MSPRAFLEVFALIVAAHVAAIVGGLLIAIPAPWWIDVPLTGLASVFYAVAAILFGLFGMGVRHLWDELQNSIQHAANGTSGQD
jgi:thiol:disulfide interchange protein